MTFMAINGLKLSKFKAGSIEGEAATGTKRQAKEDLSKVGLSDVTEPDTAETTGAKEIDVPNVDDDDEIAPTEPPLGAIKVGSKKVDILDPSAVPMRVLNDLANVDETPVSTPSDIVYAARAPGQGNHPWVFKLADDDSLWKVSYGGQGKGTATVRQILAE